MNKNVFLAGWISALILGLIMLSVHTELRTLGVIVGCALTPVIAVVLALVGSVTSKYAVVWSDIKDVTVGSSITAAVFLFSYWMGVLNA